jgi:hypothetical protein
MNLRFLTLVFSLLLIQCKEQTVDCPPNTSISEYSITGKCTGNNQDVNFTHASISWQSDSVARINFIKDTCNSTILLFDLRSISLSDSIFSSDTVALPFATIGDSEDDVSYTPLKNSYCSECYVWFNRVDANTYFIDVKLAFEPWGATITRFLGKPTDSVYVEAELMLKKN